MGLVSERNAYKYDQNVAQLVQSHFAVIFVISQFNVYILQTLAWVSDGVYKNWCLESSFVLNLINPAGANYHVNESEGNQLAAGYTFVSV